MAAATLAFRPRGLGLLDTGEVRDTVKMAQKAREVGSSGHRHHTARHRRSPQRPIFCLTHAQENTEVYAPMTSRVAHAVLIDVISTASCTELRPADVEPPAGGQGQPLGPAVADPPERPRRKALAMRVFVASLATETNTFSPIPTDRRAFEDAF